MSVASDGYIYFTDNQLPPKPLDHASFFDLTTRDVAGNLRQRTIHTLETMSIPVE